MRNYGHTSTPLRLFDLLSGVRIDLPAIPGDVRSVEQQYDHKNDSGDHEKQKPFHLAV
jgi:hypothetical protein